MFVSKHQKILMGQSKIDNLVKLARQGTQNGDEKTKTNTRVGHHYTQTMIPPTNNWR